MKLPEYTPPSMPKPKRIKVWFNPEANWYEAFMPDGTKLPALCEISITDSVYKESPKALIDAIVEVVNERPVKNDSIGISGSGKWFSNGNKKT